MCKLTLISLASNSSYDSPPKRTVKYYYYCENEYGLEICAGEESTLKIICYSETSFTCMQRSHEEFILHFTITSSLIESIKLHL